MKKLIELINQTIRLITHDIWHPQQARIDSRDLMLIKLVKIIFIAIVGFLKDKVSLRSSALTFYTLMAVVPVFAVLLGIAKGFGLNEQLLTSLGATFEQQQEIIQLLTGFSESLLTHGKSSLITGVSVIFLIWAVLSLLNNIEASFNHIWQVKKSRPWSRKIADYLTVIVVAPIFLMASGSITVVLHSKLAISGSELMSYVAPLAKAAIKLSSYLLIWGVFTFVYIAMPFTKVRFVPGLIAGIITGSISLLMQNFYIYSQVMVSKYSTIYGNFAAIPLFLIFAQLSWLILLFGAELAFAIQNVERYEYELASQSISQKYKKLIALLVTKLIVNGFEQGGKPLTSEDIANKIGLPVRLARELAYELTECNILVQTHTDDEKVSAYIPAVDIHKITVGMVLERLDEQGTENFALPESTDTKKIEELLSRMAASLHSGEGAKLIMKL
ncbi:MAG: YihY/virulence factor BrkB family protein [Prevotellaceae bacterium]|jgi:membrane protein|nr:YihY/virulence factor BrkB family protein [Prevotellaceae bacterium]